MQAGTTTVATSTGSKTIADLLGRAAEQYGDRVAARHKVDGAWHDVTYAQAGEVVREIGLGLIDLGHRARRARLPPRQDARRVDVLRLRDRERRRASSCRSTPTNSPEECEWVAGNSESVAVICEDAAQVAKIVAVRDRLPDLRTIVVIDPAGDTADAVAARRGPRARAARATRPSSRRAPPPSRPRTRSRSSTRRGRPARRRAASSPTATTGARSTCARRSASCAATEEIYLFLPLAHAFAPAHPAALRTTSATRSRTSAATRTRSSPSCRRSSRPTCRASRGSSRRSTRSSWPRSPRRSRRR